MLPSVYSISRLLDYTTDHSMEKPTIHALISGRSWNKIPCTCSFSRVSSVGQDLIIKSLSSMDQWGDGVARICEKSWTERCLLSCFNFRIRNGLRYERTAYCIKSWMMVLEGIRVCSKAYIRTMFNHWARCNRQVYVYVLGIVHAELLQRMNNARRVVRSGLPDDILPQERSASGHAIRCCHLPWVKSGLNRLTSRHGLQIAG